MIDISQKIQQKYKDLVKWIEENRDTIVKWSMFVCLAISSVVLIWLFQENHYTPLWWEKVIIGLIYAIQLGISLKVSQSMKTIKPMFLIWKEEAQLKMNNTRLKSVESQIEMPSGKSELKKTELDTKKWQLMERINQLNQNLKEILDKQVNHRVYTQDDLKNKSNILDTQISSYTNKLDQRAMENKVTSLDPKEKLQVLKDIESLKEKGVKLEKSIQDLKDKAASDLPFAEKEILQEEEKKQKELYSSASNALGLNEGTVRSYLIVLLGGFILYIILARGLRDGLENLVVPTDLLIILSFFLVYYGFKPDQLLPKALLVNWDNFEAQSNEDLIKNFPTVQKTIQMIVDSVNLLYDDCTQAINAIDRFQKILAKTTEDNLDYMAQLITEIINDLTARISSFQHKIEEIESLTKRFVNKIPSGIEGVGFMFLLLILAIVNILFIGTLHPLDGNYQYIITAAASTLSLIAIAFGKTLEKTLHTSAQNPVLEGIERFKAEIGTLIDTLEERKVIACCFLADLKAKIIVASAKISSELTDLKKSVEASQASFNCYVRVFRSKNIFHMLPSDIAAIIAIIVGGFITALLFAVATPMFINADTAFDGPLLKILVFIVSAYFYSKK